MTQLRSLELFCKLWYFSFWIIDKAFISLVFLWSTSLIFLSSHLPQTDLDSLYKERSCVFIDPITYSMTHCHFCMAEALTMIFVESILRHLRQMIDAGEVFFVFARREFVLPSPICRSFFAWLAFFALSIAAKSVRRCPDQKGHCSATAILSFFLSFKNSFSFMTDFCFYFDYSRIRQLLFWSRVELKFFGFSAVNQN